MVLELGFDLPHTNLSWAQRMESALSKCFRWIEVKAPAEPNKRLASSITKTCTQYGLRLMVHANYLGINLASSHPLVRKASVKAIINDLKFAQFVGAEFLILHGGDTGWFDILPPSHAEFSAIQKTHQMLRSKAIASLVTSLKELIDYKETHNYSVKFLIENLYCPWELLNTPLEIQEVVGFVNSSTVGVCLDFGHAQISAHAISEYCQTLLADVRALHLHENDLGFDIHMPIDTVRSTWVGVLEKLHQLERVIPAIIELPNQPWDKVLLSFQTLDTLIHQSFQEVIYDGNAKY